MRVLMIANEFPPVIVGGLGVATAHLARALTAAGHDVTVVTARGLHALPERSTEGRLTLLRPPVAMRRSMGARLLRENVAWMTAALAPCQRGEFDLIHCQGWLPALAAVQLHELCALPLVTTVHSTEPGMFASRGLPPAPADADPPLALLWEEELLRSSTALITVSAAIAAEVREHYKCRRPIHVVHNGVPRDPAALTRRDGDPVKRLLFVGRLVPEKGLEWALEGLAQLGDLPFVLEVAGRDWGARGYGAHLRARAAQLGLGDRVHFLGFVEPAELEARYRAADALLVPSRYEPFGIVVLEGMRHGLAVIAAKTGGIVEIVDDSLAQLVDPGSAEQLAAAVRRLFTDGEAVAARVKRAREVAASRFSWETIAEQTLAVYRSACG